MSETALASSPLLGSYDHFYNFVVKYLKSSPLVSIAATAWFVHWALTRISFSARPFYVFHNGFMRLAVFRSFVAFRRRTMERTASSQAQCMLQMNRYRALILHQQIKTIFNHIFLCFSFHFISFGSRECVRAQEMPWHSFSFFYFSFFISCYSTIA